MKKKQLLLLAATVLVLLASCGKKVDVAFSTATVEIAPEGATVEVTLTSNGDWNLEGYPDWLTVSPTSGKGDATIMLTASVNDSDETRSGEISATTKDNAASFTVTQQPRVKNSVSVSPTQQEIDFEGGTFEITVTANCDWTVTTSDEWLNFDPTSGTGNGIVTVTVEPLVGDVSQRVGNIFFGGSENEMVSVQVTQYAEVPVFLTVSPEVLAFDYMAGEQTVAVSCNGDWTASCDADWVTVGTVSGNGDAQVVINVSENTVVVEARAANVNFISETGIEVTVDVKQEGAPDPHYLVVNPLSVSFESDGGTADINISCDEDWTIELQSTWVSLSATSGVGDGIVTLTVEANTISEQRSVIMAVVSGGLSERVRVTQAAGEVQLQVNIESDTLFAPYSGSLEHFFVTANTSWTLVNNVDWIRLLTDSGDGDAEVAIAVDINSSEESRVTTLNIVHGFMTMDNIVIVQEGRPNILQVDVTEIQAGPEGGEYTVHVTANQTWTIQKSVNWLACYPMSGTNNGEFLVKIEPLPMIQPRSTELRIYGSSGSTLVIPVTQSH